ncbi:MAG: glycosyl hydrolase, partial [Saprospiraceae bacterium]|nr:glycosyl hydrolase [Saprospiraceae bacterium]
MKKLIRDGTSVKAKLRTYGSCLCCSLFLVFCSAPESSHDGPDSAEMFNTELSSTNKPWTRWWWHGSSVTREGITAELEAYANAGIGGVELTPIYGMQGDESNFVNFLSPEWIDHLEHALNEAERLGMGVDIATGTGWPFGGPWIGTEDASKYFDYKKYQIDGGEMVSEPITLQAAPLLRTVRPSHTNIADLKQPISTNDDLQALAIDQVRFPNNMHLETVVAYAEDGRIEDLTSKMSKSSELDWIAPEGTWTVYAVFMGWHGKMVERAAPGGEGNVIDHFSGPAIENYLSRFDSAFSGRPLSSIRAFFNDSYEVDDAQGQADWTTDFLDEFEERRGYDLRRFLPALVGEDSDDRNQRVLTDYRETISDLLLEKFTRTWVGWAHGRGSMVRNQAHGSPANILDLYAACDIPETEGTDLIKIKMASSAAHLADRQLVSAEAATWLGEHFSTNLADLKENIDRYLVGGINHVVYHGTCYSPSEMPWPGRLFYAAIHANPRNPLWQHYPAFNRYVGRVQSLLQRSQPDNSILLYFPIYDRYAARGQEMLEHFDGSLENNGPTQVRKIAELLLDRGYAFDFVSDRQLTMSGFSDEDKADHLSGYRTIIIPATFIPLNTVQTLAALADQGMNIIFEEMPKHVPGLHEAEAREEELDS